MGWYEAIKDGINIAQKADNIPLVQGLIEAQKQVLDLIQENNALKSEIKRLHDNSEIAKKIERHDISYVTLNDDSAKVKYCSSCWDKENKLIQISMGRNKVSFSCPNSECNNQGMIGEIKQLPV